MGGRVIAVMFDFPDNDIAMSNYLSDQMEKMTKPFNANISRFATEERLNSVPYQSTHNTGAVMGARSPRPAR